MSKETVEPTKTGIPDWLGVKVPLKNKEISAKSEEEEEEEEEEGEEEKEKLMCNVCFQFYCYKRCEGCAEGWKDKARHPCRDYGENLCPECDTDPAIFWP